jgi:trehalose 6-phosphate phosphatase
MTDVLSKKSRAVLARYALSNLLVGFDYDGTLAPIVASPQRARMRAITRRLLIRVAERYPCIIISGRARDDLMQRLGDVPVVHVSGNHGLEPWAEHVRYATRVREWVQLLAPRLAACQGVTIEDKTYSLSLHYRAARDKRRAVGEIDAALRLLRRARRIAGKLVVNVVPAEAPGKGDALERARRLLQCDATLYVGDDDTDEEAFRARRSAHFVSVRVGPTNRTQAGYLLKDQRHIDRLLRQLAAFRPRRRVEAPQRFSQ